MNFSLFFLFSLRSLLLGLFRLNVVNKLRIYNKTSIYNVITPYSGFISLFYSGYYYSPYFGYSFLVSTGAST
jgi:hypothetical protein